MTVSVTPRTAHRTNVRRVDAVLGGPVWWATHLGVTYWLVPRACAWQTAWPLHLVTVLTVVLCGRAWLSAVQLLRGARAAPGVDPTAPRDIYLAWIGILLSIFFGAVTLYEGIPAVILDPCF